MTSKRQKPGVPEKPVYEFPVAFTWGPSVMETHEREEERYALAIEAFRALADRKTDIIIRFQFFDFKSVRYRLASYGPCGNEKLPHIWCDIDGKFEESLFGDLFDGSMNKSN